MINNLDIKSSEESNFSLIPSIMSPNRRDSGKKKKGSAGILKFKKP